MAQSLRLHFGLSVWAILLLFVIAGSQSQTDEQFHLKNHTDKDTQGNAEIILELLWGGIEITANETIRIKDEELATLRPAKHLLWIFQHKVPKNPSGIEEYLDHFSQSDTPITPEEFEQLLFTTVFTAYQIRIVQGLDKNLWINLFSQLVNEILRELCKQFCSEELTASAQNLASRSWQEMPAYVNALKKFYQPSFVMIQGN
ncbi:PREDICTED: protein FAM180B [Thamnophis sirtalis]|uniref:Protein FAM180B n=1 Tax=Thamnophis sirtalis TaxID=35019 RepID=A0A6I9X5E4_9SAUR|nr:PREDICTED: protein FAM180B [Thamnophis sirtalis]